MCFVTMNLGLDYEHHAVLIGYFMYLFHDKYIYSIPFCYASMFKEPWALLGFGLNLTYNGERGRQNKLFNYFFYPVHFAYFRNNKNDFSYLDTSSKVHNNCVVLNYIKIYT